MKWLVAFWGWLDARLPVQRAWDTHMGKYYAPKNFNFWYFFGVLSLLVLVNQLLTGIWLTMSYEPSAERAFASVEYIMRDVDFGYVLRYMHSTGGAIMMADEDTVEMYSQTGGFGDLGRLLMEGQTALREVTLDVLTEENCDLYWDRSDRFDTVLDITFPRPGLDALCRAMEVWIGHFLVLEARIHPVQSIRDERWRWHVGLDTTSTGILNALYNGEDVPEERMARLLSLFRLEIKDQALVLDDVAGKPVYLGLAMDETNRVQMKPQNLLTNLPLLAGF